MKRYLITMAVSLALLSTILSMSAFLSDEGATTSSFFLATGGEFGITVSGNVQNYEPIEPAESVSIAPTVNNNGDYDAFIFAKAEMSEDFDIDSIADAWCVLDSQTEGGMDTYILAYGTNEELSVFEPASTQMPFDSVVLSDGLTADPLNPTKFYVTVTFYAIQTIGYEAETPADLAKVVGAQI